MVLAGFLTRCERDLLVHSRLVISLLLLLDSTAQSGNHLHHEWAHGPPDLEYLGFVPLELNSRISIQDQSTKLGPVISDINSIWFVINDGVAPWHRYIIYPDFRVVTPAHFESGLALLECQHMHSAWWVPLQGQTLHDQVVLLLLTTVQIDKFIDLILNFENVRVRMLTYLTFKAAPVEWLDVALLLRRHFQIEPIFETFEVNKAYRAWALARHYARVVKGRVGAPTVFALGRVRRIGEVLLGWRNSTIIVWGGVEFDRGS